MATECIAYRDSKGELHATVDRATLSDLAMVLGRVGDEGGMTDGVAKLIFDMREEIERVFAEHDAIMARVHVEESGEQGHTIVERRGANGRVLRAVDTGDDCAGVADR